MRNYFALLCILTFIVFQSCDNTIDINAPYKETPVVFGLLDPGQSTQYIRITKTFQNSANLTPQQAAQNPDLMYFDSTLQVNLYNLNDTSKHYSFTRTNNIPKDQGYFTNAVNYLYMCNMTPEIIDSKGKDVKYKLVIYNPQSGNTYSAITSITGLTSLMTGNYSTYSLDIYYSTPPYPVLFEWEAAKGGAIYTAIIRYHYKEGPKGSTPSVLKTVDMIVASNEETKFNLNKIAEELNQFLINYFGKIDASTGIDPSVFSRSMESIDYVVQAGSFDLKNAVDFSKPNTSLLQVQPNYSNIPNGLGIFSSRSTSVKPMLWNAPTEAASKKNLTKLVCGFPQ